MAVIGVDFSVKFPDTPPCYCVAVRNGEVVCVLMTGKAKRIVRQHKVRKELATAALIYYAVKPLARRRDVILIDAEYDAKYLKRVRTYLEKTLRVSSIGVGRISEPARKSRQALQSF